MRKKRKTNFKSKTKTGKPRISHYSEKPRMDKFKAEMDAKHKEAAHPSVKKARPVQVIRRDELGHYLPGQSGNKLGVPTLGNTRLERLLAAIRKFEKETDQDLLRHYIAESFKDNSVLMNLISKLHPSLQAIALASLEDNSMSNEMAQSIQEKLRRRFESKSETPPPSKEDDKNPT